MQINDRRLIDIQVWNELERHCLSDPLRVADRESHLHMSPNDYDKNKRRSYNPNPKYYQPSYLGLPPLGIPAGGWREIEIRHVSYRLMLFAHPVEEDLWADVAKRGTYTVPLWSIGNRDGIRYRQN